MNRRAWKWILGISIGLFILLVLFTFGLWVLANVGGVLMRIVFILDEDFRIHSISFAEFMSNFAGSPLFYAYLLDITAFLLSGIALLVTRKTKKRSSS